jgi:methyltransferase-like protein
LPDHVARRIGEMAHDVIEREQYMDFVRNRALRQTLPCHEDVPIRRRITLQRMLRLCVASRAQPADPGQDVHAVEEVEFRVADGAALSTDHPVTKKAMRALSEVWPRPVPYRELLARSRSRLGLAGTDAGRDRQLLAANLLAAYGYSGNLVELHAYVPQMALEVGDRPVASPLARLQAGANVQITSLRHERVQVGAFGRHLLPPGRQPRSRRPGGPLAGRACR